MQSDFELNFISTHSGYFTSLWQKLKLTVYFRVKTFTLLYLVAKLRIITCLLHV